MRQSSRMKKAMRSNLSIRTLGNIPHDRYLLNPDHDGTDPPDEAHFQVSERTYCARSGFESRRARKPAKRWVLGRLSWKTGMCMEDHMFLQVVGRRARQVREQAARVWVSSPRQSTTRSITSTGRAGGSCISGALCRTKAIGVIRQGFKMYNKILKRSQFARRKAEDKRGWAKPQQTTTPVPYGCARARLQFVSRRARAPLLALHEIQLRHPARAFKLSHTSLKSKFKICAKGQVAQ